MKNKLFIPLAIIGSFVFVLQATAQNVIVNGGFDTWTNTTGTTVVSGTPTGWTYSGTIAPVEGPTISTGSGTSALITNGAPPSSSTGVLTQNVSSANLKTFNISFDLAVARNSPAREFQMILTQGTNQTINLIINAGSTGKMTVQAHNGSGWQTIGTADMLNDSGVYTPGTNSFASLNEYNISLSVDWAAATPTYSFTYTPSGGSSTTIGGLNYFFTAVTNSGVVNLSAVQFFGANSATGGYYAIDNVSLSAIPEPVTIAALATGGLLLLGGRLMRRKL